MKIKMESRFLLAESLNFPINGNVEKQIDPLWFLTLILEVQQKK